MTSPPQSWQAPISLEALALPEWPKDSFPEEVQGFIRELAESTETPIELASMTTISGIAAAAQGKFLVQIKSDYFEPVNIWTAVGLPPGNRKSAVQQAVIAPITQWEKRKKDALERIITATVAENECLEIRIKELKRRCSLAEGDDFEKLKNEIIFLEEKIKVIPTVPQIWTADITPENLGVLMLNNKECMAVLSDEVGIFDILSGRYSAGIPNLDLFLQAHSGSSVRVNRGCRPPVFLDKPALTMGLTPQPEVLRGLTKIPAFRGRGLLARFLYALPESNLGSRSLDAKSLSEQTRSAYSDIIMNILDISIDDGKSHILCLSKAAYDVWHAYALVVEIRMGEGGPFVYLRDWAAKLPGAIIRIAGLIHIARHAKNAPWEHEISQKDMQAAIKIAHVLSDHALAVFDLMGSDPAIEGARTILSWLKRNNCKRFTFRDCHYAHKSKFKRAKEMEPSIEVLVERYYIRESEVKQKPHRPSRFFEVNPYIYKNEGLSC